MNGSADIDTDEGLLKSTIALMLGLALQAERVAGRCYAIRCLVLWVLRRAEPIALRHVLGLDEAPEMSTFTTLFRNSSADALELAELFRAAAQILKGQLRELQRFDRWWARQERGITDDRDLLTSPFEGGGRTKGPGGGESAPLHLAASLRECSRSVDHAILARARIPAWAAINWPDTS